MSKQSIDERHSTQKINEEHRTKLDERNATKLEKNHAPTQRNNVHRTKLEIKPSNRSLPRRLSNWNSSETRSDWNITSKSDIGSSVQKDNLDSSAIKSTTSKLKSVNEIPSVDNDIRITKLYLQKQGAHNLSVWTHLTNVLNKIVSEQPDNVIDYFEEYSRKVKEEQLSDTGLLKDIYVPLPHIESAKNQLSLLNSREPNEDVEEPVAGEEEEDKEPSTQMDLEEAAFYFREAGIAVPDMQLFNISIAMRKITEENGLVKPRFWGKIFGTKQDYFILEGELTDEEYQKRIEIDEMEEAAEAERLAAEAEEQQQEEQGEEDKIGEEEEPQSITEEERQKESVISTKESLKSEEEHGSGDSKHYMQRIYMNIEEEKSREDLPQGEEEDPLLPPLPPPKKLLTYKVPPILKPVPKETIKIPTEKPGEGLNRKIYYVCNTPELEWVELPKVTPELINVSQQIKVYFTGDLESKLITYPAFPGDEKHYLRAQIARISAATHVSPIGFYKFPGGGGDEEEEEEVAEEEEEGGANQKTVEENKKYQPIPIKDLIDPSFASWVHHSRYILKQGRADWWSAKKAEAGEDEAEEEQEEEEDEEKEGGEEKEVGPPLLTPLSEDQPVDGLPAWAVRKTRTYNPNMAGAAVKSNVWPGAHAFAVGRKCENVYFGWGHKLNLQGFSPASLPHPEYEYDLGPEVLEIQDPTVEVEQAWREAHKKKPPPVEGEEEEEGEGEGEEEEEEEEDD